jgi:hypothetical protein
MKCPVCFHRARLIAGMMFVDGRVVAHYCANNHAPWWVGPSMPWAKAAADRFRLAVEEGFIGGQASDGSVPTPKPRAVQDWPCRCPKCGRANAAVLLFTSYDCRFGCYGAKDGVL